MSEQLSYPWDAETKVALPPRVPQLDQRATKLAGAPRYMPNPFATGEAPPLAEKGHIVRRAAGAWVQVPHRRGETVYDKATGAERKIDDQEIGVPKGMTTLKPGPAEKWDEKSGEWAKNEARAVEMAEETAREQARQAALERVKSAMPDEVSATDVAIVLGLRAPPVAE